MLPTGPGLSLGPRRAAPGGMLVVRAAAGNLDLGFVVLALSLRDKLQICCVWIKTVQKGSEADDEFIFKLF